MNLADANVLVVGVGGLGCPAAMALARAGVQRMTIVDDDRVDASNLHRQVLFVREDVGEPKAIVAAKRLNELGVADARAVTTRLAVDNVAEITAGHDLVVEGADNFATKFLVADACGLASIPVVQAGAVRWSGWALATLPGLTACLRCVFEDIPTAGAGTCNDAGVMGSVVGVLGSLEAALGAQLLESTPPAGALLRFDGLALEARTSHPRQRSDCPLCSGKIKEKQ